MSKSRARLLAELLNASGRVKKDKSDLAGADSIIDLDTLPTITNAKLENSSISVAGHSVSLGGSVSLNTGDITEHTDYKYYTDARVRAAISVDGSLSYNSNTGVLSYTTPTTIASLSNHDTDNLAEGTNLYFTNARARSAISVSGDLAYNSTTGVVSFTERTDAEVRELVSASGSLSYNSSTGVISYTQPTNISTFTNDSSYITNSTASLDASKITGGTLNYARIPIPANGDWWNNGYVRVQTDGVMEVGKYLDFHTADSGGGTDYDVRITASSGAIDIDGDLTVDAITASGAVTWSGGSSTNANTAYGWGNHASQGYATLASPALTGTPTAPTATAGTNTTQIATTAFVGTAVSNLVDSAPGTLNTLNELAAALGDDANFSTTVTNSIATKLPLAGGTMTGELKSTSTSAQAIKTRFIAGAANGSTADGPLYLQYGRGQDIRMFENSGQNRKLYIYGNDNGTDRWGGLSVGTDGSFTVQASDTYLLLQAASYIQSNSPHNFTSSLLTSGTVWLDSSRNATFANLTATGSTSLGNISSNSLTVASGHNVHLTNGNITIGDYGNTNTGTLFLRGSTANKQAALKATNGNLHIDSNAGNNTYINYYTGSGTYFGSGAGGVVAVMGPDGDLWKGSADNAGSKYWHAGNDGSGSGLDADLLDGINSSSFLRSDQSDSMSGELNVTRNGGVTGTSAPQYTEVNIELQTGSNHVPGISFHRGGYSATTLYEYNGELYVNAWTTRAQTGKLVSFGNDGSGSGLDADTLDGSHASAFVTTTTFNNNDRIYITDTRGANRAPSYYDYRYVQADFTQNAYLGLSSGVDAWGTVLTVSKWASYDASHRQEQLIFAGTKLARRVATSDSAWSSTHTIWDSSTDGSGSGLDADTLDGINSSSFLRSDSSDNFTSGTLSFSSTTALKMLNGSNFDASSGDVYANLRVIRNAGTANLDGMYIGYLNSNSGLTRIFGGGQGSGGIYISGSGANDIKYNNSSVFWHAGNDGAGSGLDADLLDGLHGSSYWQKSGSWYGDLGSNGYDRVQGVAYTGGEFVLVEKNSQMSTLIDGDYFAYEAGGFFSSSSSAYGDLSGFKAYNTNTIQVQQKDGGNANLRVTGSITRAGNTVWDSGNDGASSGLDADLIDGMHRYNHHGVGELQSITVYGDADKYYPVVITGGSTINSEFEIYRGFNEQAPAAWNTSTHQGGLTFRYRITGSSGWGGYPTKIHVYEAGEIYTTVLGGIAYTAHSMKHVVWLRGGSTTGARYHIFSPSDFSVVIYDDTSSGYTSGSGWLSYDSSNNTYDTYVNYRTLAQRNAAMEGEIYNNMSVSYSNAQTHTSLSGTGPAKTYWHTSNDGGGSGLDADTLDGVQGSSFLRSDAADTATGALTFSGSILSQGHSSGANWMPFTDGNFYIRAPNVFFDSSTNVEFNDEIRVVTGSIAESDSTKGLMFDGNYETGQYRHRFRKRDLGAGIPLFIDYAHGTANSYTPIIRFGGGGNYKELSVYGDQEITGQLVIDNNIASPANYYSGLQMEVRATSGTAGIGLHRNGYSHVGIYTNTINRLDFDFNSGDVIMNHNAGTLWGSGNDGSGSGLDADLLDGLQATAFIRKDIDDSVAYSNRTQWYSNTNLATTTGYQASLEVYTSGVGNDAFMSFHVGGDYAIYLGLDGGTNKLSVGGWSMGAASYEIYHAGNKPSLATLGYTGATNANYITNNNQLTNGAGYITASGTANQSLMVSGSSFATTSSPSSVLEYQQAASITDTKLAPSSDWHNSIRMGHGNPYSYYSNTIAVRMTGSGLGDLYTQTISNNNAQGWNKHWHNNNDGAGSGLDADTVDGKNSTDFTYYRGIVSGDWDTIFTTGTGKTGTSSLYEVHNITSGSHSNYPSGAYTYGGVFAWYLNNSTFKLYAPHVGNLYYQTGWGNDEYSGWRKIWDNGNDGSGSGLDADLLDGIHASSFLRSDANDTASGQYTFTKTDDHAIQIGTIRGTAVGSQSGQYIHMYERVHIGGPSGWGASNAAAPSYGLSTYGGANLATNTGTVTIAGNTAWHAGNDGSGSGLDADLLDGNDSTAFPKLAATNTWGNNHINYFRTERGGYVGSINTANLQAYTTGANSAFMSFHRSGSYAVNFGLDADNVLRIGGWSASANRWVLDMSGNMTAAGNVTAYSDIRLKENIEVIPNALEKVKQIRGVTFTRNDQDDKEARHTGVIAQEVEKVLPEVISEDNLGIKNVAYGNMVGLLIEAVKELKQEVDDLKAQLKEKQYASNMGKT